MTLVQPKVPPGLYDADFYAWTQRQAQLIRERRLGDVDWENLAEEIESVGRSEKAEIRSRLAVLLQHLLKWQFQPEQRSHSWQSSISEQRIHIAGLIEDSPSLRRYPAEVLARCYGQALRRAASDTDLPASSFPEPCPYTVEQVLDDAFLPGRPWTAGGLLRD